MKKILIIEDDEETRRFYALVLVAEGFEVLESSDGITGIALAKQHQPDLILSDITMAGLDGHGVLSALRGDPRTVAIPLIFHSALDGHADIRSGMNLGADDYLTKPATADEVISAIRTRLARFAAQQKATLGAVEVAPDFSSSIPLQERFGLTKREAEVLLWVAQGKSNGEVAAILGNAEQTVKIHLIRAFEKLGVENRSAATGMVCEILSKPRVSQE